MKLKDKKDNPKISQDVCIKINTAREMGFKKDLKEDDKCFKSKDRYQKKVDSNHCVEGRTVNEFTCPWNFPLE